MLTHGGWLEVPFGVARALGQWAVRAVAGRSGRVVGGAEAALWATFPGTGEHA